MLYFQRRCPWYWYAHLPKRCFLAVLKVLLPTEVQQTKKRKHVTIWRVFLSWIHLKFILIRFLCGERHISSEFPRVHGAATPRGGWTTSVESNQFLKCYNISWALVRVEHRVLFSSTQFAVQVLHISLALSKERVHLFWISIYQCGVGPPGRNYT